MANLVTYLMPSQSRLVFIFEWLLGGPCMSCGNQQESICPSARVQHFMSVMAQLRGPMAFNRSQLVPAGH